MFYEGRSCFTGLDLGQSRDHTGFAVVDRVERRGEWDPRMFAHQKMAPLRLRYLERVPLGTPYPDVVERVRDVTNQVALNGRGELLVDATGVGRPVVDLLRRAHLKCWITPVVVTGGLATTHANDYVHVPKRDLIIGLQVAMQTGALQIAAGLAHEKTLMKEMADMRVAVSSSGNEQFGAWRQGSHDDLVFAVALACWGAKRAYPRDLNGQAGWWQVRPV